jgi:putative restriction endonuclease
VRLDRPELTTISVPPISISSTIRATTIRAGGLALCKNAHWLFDNGLWSLDDDYRSLVASDRFDEDAPDQKSLNEYAGHRIRLPSNELIWPDLKHLAWHRDKKFEGN